MTLHTHSFELKIPPPVLALLLLFVMWGISLLTPPIALPPFIPEVASRAVALIGGALSLAGAISFRLAKTTVNPLKPEKASSLVRSGIYRFTRNPMYLGLLFVLLAGAMFLSSAWALVGPLAFVLYINRFQIAPEEKILAAKFGADYSAYCAKVRRWL
jgi:protein-S-isoprenylcysteine O-methyltransferase Ste14